MVKTAYEALKKKYPVLPAFKDLDKHFEISDIEKDTFLLRKIKRNIGEKLEPVLELLEHCINPDPNSFSDMYECSCFSNSDKKQVVEVFRHLMEQYRSLLETDLMVDDKVDAETIAKIYGVWQEDTKIIIPFFKKIRECWQKHVEPKEILEYLG